MGRFNIQGVEMRENEKYFEKDKNILNSKFTQIQ